MSIVTTNFLIPFLKREEALDIGFLLLPRVSCYLTYSCRMVTPHLNSISISVSRTMICSTSDIKTVQGNLGHATAAFTLDVYGHVTDQMKEDSANRMERFIHSVRTA